MITNATTGNVIDGHARIEEALKLGDDTPVPFIEVELSEDEEAKILATFDPISAMAVADKEQLDALLREVETADAAVMQMLDDLAKANGIAPTGADEWGAAFGTLPDEDRAPFQQMTFTLHDTQAEDVKRAVKLAGKMGDFSDSANKNGNGNALAFICAEFLENHGDG